MSEGCDLASVAGLSVFSLRNHGDSAMQTGCLLRGFKNHNNDSVGGWKPDVPLKILARRCA